jgi:hypothetical protein
MTIPPPHDPWDQDIRPVDPEQLPPGFYFPPGHEPKPPARGLSSGLKWLLVVVAVVVVIVGIVVAVVVSGGSGGDGASGVIAHLASVDSDET